MSELFTPENSAMLLIDHQVGTMGWVRSANLADIEMNTVVLAKAGVTLTTTNQLIAELAEDWSSGHGQKLIGILFQDVLSKMS